MLTLPFSTAILDFQMVFHTITSVVLIAKSRGHSSESGKQKCVMPHFCWWMDRRARRMSQLWPKKLYLGLLEILGRTLDIYSIYIVYGHAQDVFQLMLVFVLLVFCSYWFVVARGVIAADVWGCYNNQPASGSGFCALLKDIYTCM